MAGRERAGCSVPERTFLSRLRSWIDTIQSGILIFLLTAVSLLVFIQVLLRYVFRAPLMGIEELLFFPTAWLYFIGGVHASFEKSQIYARVLEILFRKKRTIYAVRAVASSITIFILAWLTYWGYDYLKYALRVQKESSTLYIPMIYAESIVFISLAMMFLYTVVELYDNLNIARQAEDEEIALADKQI